MAGTSTGKNTITETKRLSPNPPNDPTNFFLLRSREEEKVEMDVFVERTQEQSQV